jgi:hypothetical protein
MTTHFSGAIRYFVSYLTNAVEGVSLHIRLRAHRWFSASQSESNVAGCWLATPGPLGVAVVTWPQDVVYTKFRWSELCGLFVILEPMKNLHVWIVEVLFFFFFETCGRHIGGVQKKMHCHKTVPLRLFTVAVCASTPSSRGV